jgi:hypothetical protein
MTDSPLGAAIDTTPHPNPEKVVHSGRSVRLGPLSEEHVPALWLAAQGTDPSWTYLRYAPFGALGDLGNQVPE